MSSPAGFSYPLPGRQPIMSVRGFPYHVYQLSRYQQPSLYDAPPSSRQPIYYPVEPVQHQWNFYSTDQNYSGIELTVILQSWIEGTYTA